MGQNAMRIEIGGLIKSAIEEIAAELDARDDIFEVLTNAEIARKLVIYGIQQHKKGIGPWAMT